MDPTSARAVSVDAGDVYERVRRAMVATVGKLSAEQLTTHVPATPEWRVRDVLAHVVGLATDLNAQQFPAGDDVGGVAWGAAQVATRRDLPLADLVDEWAREAPTFEDGLRLFGYGEGCHFVADLHAHHQDVRGALGLSRDDDPLAVAVALDHYLGFVHEMLRDAVWGTLEVCAGNETRLLGTDGGSYRAVVTGSAFEVLRAFSARRSAAQIRRLRWHGDVDALLALMEQGFSGGYSIPVDDVVE
ncbi:MAG: maleylpyruvate isomerase N-terminal domain-containing protein [Ilumatobacteraceae bacterium]